MIKRSKTAVAGVEPAEGNETVPGEIEGTPVTTGIVDTPVTTGIVVTEEMLEKINRHTRRPLQPEEVYAFTLILCDNEVDRDLERFPLESLEKLAELYLGKTGVFDHNPTAQNQSARIFDTALEQTGETNSVGEGYARLRAWAYMVRCDKNADLILEIDAGIKKEVSVGCAVESVLCSICGEDQKAGGCTHQKGQVYEGRLCHHLLVNPTDAYEWSFVAVPAQKNAGVTKRGRQHGGSHPVMVPVEKEKLRRLEQLAEAGRKKEAALREQVVRLGLLGNSGLSAGELEAIASHLELPELAALEKSFRGLASSRYPLQPQLGRPEPDSENEPSDRDFRI